MLADSISLEINIKVHLSEINIEQLGKFAVNTYPKRK